MNAGILSFHDVMNPGAFFQVLGTQQLLERNEIQAQVIDYTPPAHRYSLGKLATQLSWRIPFRMRLLLQARKKLRAYEQAQKKWMNLTPRFSDHQELTNYPLDHVVIGADVVWDFITKKYGQDPVYFGHHLNTQKLISFSPSCGTCSDQDIVPEYVQTGLKKFNSLSVRDLNTQRMTDRAIGIKPPILCDPAFHLDLSVFDAKRPIAGRYVAIYMLPQFVDDQTKAAIKDFASKRGLEVVATTYEQPWADRNFFAHSPTEWLSTLRHAEFVFTNTFHGIVFCTKLEKEFSFQYTPSIRLKSLDMVDQLGIEPLLMKSEEDLASRFQTPFDFSKTRQAISQLTKQGADYLTAATKGNE